MKGRGVFIGKFRLLFTGHYSRLNYCSGFCITRNIFPLQTYYRSLSNEAREAFLSALVSEGRAEWLDKGHRKCLILWHRVQDWADIILQFVKENGLEDSVMTVEEIRSGIESRGTELHGMDRTVLMRALKVLENKGKLAVFKGTSADDEGVKFSI
ncbi:hypothetical protein ACOSQ2_017455 [Xanthoceras sorbifolium]